MQSTISQKVQPELMKTIFFTNRERIEIGDDHIQYMTYLQKKLPRAAYDLTEEKPDTPIKKKRS